MSKSWWTRFLILVGVSLLSALYVYPTITNMDVQTSKFPFKQKINLGLDLQGGLYLVLGVDFNKVFKEISERQATSLEQNLKEKGHPFKSVKTVRDGFPPDDPRILLQFDASKKSEILEAIKKEHWNLRLTEEKGDEMQFGLTKEYRTDVREKTISQSIEVIRNRIDEFGVSEPAITSQGLDRVVVELPGVKEVDRAKDLIGRTAKLEFKMVDRESMSDEQLRSLIVKVGEEKKVTFKEGDKLSEYIRNLNEALKGKIPEGREVAFSKGEDGAPGSGPAALLPYLLFSKVEVTGQDLQDASVGFDQDTRAPHVAFSLNPKGAVVFDKLSGENIGKQMAIVLDNIVHSAPQFVSRIPNGRGQITLGRGNNDQTMREAKDLAIVLRAGALPAQLEFLEQRVVGPSLGQDSIKKGTQASLIGCILVFLFILYYYRFSGAIAVGSLLLNVLFVVAILVGLEATLTLPGIAGIALTVGIAVDSNVVIYERIREEIRDGKRPFVAVQMGFEKAFRTILDANVTNAAAAIVLLMYGTGPIKGFAVTMLVGILTTLFTAIFVCRVAFDAYLKRLERTGAEISI